MTHLVPWCETRRVLWRPGLTTRSARRSVSAVSLGLIALLTTILSACGDVDEATPAPQVLDQAVTDAVQGTVSPDHPLVPLLVSDVEVVSTVPATALEVDVGEEAHLPVRVTWRIPGVDTDDREASDIVTLRREPGGWTRMSPVRLPWGVSDPVSTSSSRCRVVGPPAVSDLVAAVHAACVRSVPAVLDVWPHWDGAAVIVLTTSALGPGTGALVEGAVSDGRPAPADRMVVDAAVAADLSEAGLDVLLRHELVHVAMRATGSAPVPLWFQEGLAGHVGYTGVADGRSEQPDEIRRLHGLRETGRWGGSVPDQARFDDPTDSAPAYVAARLGVEVLMNAVGSDLLLSTVAGQESEVAGGDDPVPRPRTDDERTRWLLTALGLSSAWFEREWAQELDRRVGHSRPSP